MKLDVRYKFFLLMLIGVVAFFAKDIIYGSMVFIIVCLLSFLIGQRKKTIKFIVFYIFKVCTSNFEQYDVNDCFMHENVHADSAIWTNVFENDTGQ